MLTLVATPSSISVPVNVSTTGVSSGVLPLDGVAIGSSFKPATSITKLPGRDIPLSSSLAVNLISTKSPAELL